MDITRDDVTAAAEASGLAGRPLEIHASLSSFGHVHGGADAVVDGLLAAGCTLVVTAFSTRIHLLPLAAVPAELRPLRNADEYVQAHATPDAINHVFDVTSTEANRGDGVTGMAVTARAGRQRGDHPLNSFAAIGPLAEVIVQGQTRANVYAPLREVARRDGVVVMMGTGLDKMTLIHAAEELAGRAPFIQWAQGRDGSPIPARVGSCSDGFEKLAPFLAPFERRRTVGRSLWRMFAAHQTLERAAEVIRGDPEITRCAKPGCACCRDAIAGGPILVGDQVGILADSSRTSPIGER
jgi:aminoglycoside 3-N-acetyltransferase